MALPSQTRRPKARGSISRRRSRRTRLIVGSTSIAIVALIFWWVWPDGGSAAAEESSAGADDQVALDRSQQPDGEQPQTPETGRPLATALTELDPGVEIPARSERPPTRGGGRRSAPAAGESQITMGSPIGPALDGDDEPEQPADPADLVAAAPEPPQLDGRSSEDDASRSIPATSGRTTDGGSAAGAPADVREALRMLQSDPLEARRRLSRALKAGGLDTALADEIRHRLSELNEELVFGGFVVPGDEFTMKYALQPGDSLAKLAKQLSLQVDWRFIQRVNGISDPSRIRAGQELKLVTGPFHVFVDKSDFRMDVYLGDGADSVYVRSFDVGLGKFDSTPTGLFRVRGASKLVDPEWRNPQTGERFAADDPENPIGERWIGIEGIDEHTTGLDGFGIHGTIDPDSIGRQDSMGCVRMHHDDVVMIYEMLVEKVSAVRIVE